jgi:hypothetical protein
MYMQEGTLSTADMVLKACMDSGGANRFMKSSTLISALLPAAALKIWVHGEGYTGSKGTRGAEAIDQSS